MGLNEIIEKLSVGNVVLMVGLAMSFIQITPIKINPWTWIARWFGRAMNGEVMKEVKSIKTDLSSVHDELNNIKKREADKDADAARNRILRFDDELRRHIKHSVEFFEQTLVDIDFYLAYCRDNKDYPNSKADSAIKHILECYEQVKKDNDFI